MPLQSHHSKKKFTFEISLSVLNHLGRNLYRSFVTVLGEAISNSWDADAKNVWIYVDKKNNSFVIKDDGIGMTNSDFQNKFLKIGYSKRNNGKSKSPDGRPFIGRKGIGKLALLSCADKITIISKKQSKNYVGGTIDNSGLDRAITKDLKPQQYPLKDWNEKAFEKYIEGHDNGTIIRFDGIKGGIKKSVRNLKKIIALYFRFSLIDSSFNVFIDDYRITYEDLKALAEKTEFLWTINELKDPFISEMLKDVKESKHLNIKGLMKGFIASVEVPRDLNIMNIEERVSVDLFVNGRLRERNILRHIPTARIVEDYLYGQIHFNTLDDKQDRFTSSREGVIADDSKYRGFLDRIKENVLRTIIDDWDKWRIKYRKPGDSENMRIAPKERKSKELFDVVSNEYTLPKGQKNKQKVDQWVDALGSDAQFNFSSYAECFISENLIRNYIKEKKIPLSDPAKKEIEKWKRVETDSKNKGNISIPIRKNVNDLAYLDMDYLAYLADMKDKGNPLGAANLSRDADEYKPMRDAMAHTSLLTDLAKQKLSSVHENIKGRIKTLLSAK
ncbi:MAG TPA: ATP-binding protein [Chitinophagaceae bacterium]|nr:ATP-binding protein [Chitinophagaceae bacterium]